MRELEKPVAQVFRRLRLQRFLGTLVWTLALALLVEPTQAVLAEHRRARELVAAARAPAPPA